MGKRLKNNERYSSFLVDAKRYDDEDVLREELKSLPKTLIYRIFELQRCPKCKKESTEHPALSRRQRDGDLSGVWSQRSDRGVSKSHPEVGWLFLMDVVGLLN